MQLSRIIFFLLPGVVITHPSRGGTLVDFSDPKKGHEPSPNEVGYLAPGCHFASAFIALCTALTAHAHNDVCTDKAPTRRAHIFTGTNSFVLLVHPVLWKNHGRQLTPQLKRSWEEILKRVQGHLDALVRMAQSCVIRVRATPKDVRAYFTNSAPVTRSGQCFAACMLEQSDIINHGKVNRDLLVHLASLVNGKKSRVVRKLHGVSRMCLDSIDGLSDRCQLASTYNDCLNENMIEFAFPLDLAEEAVRKMPFHLMSPNLPETRM